MIKHREFFIPLNESKLPVYAETVGCNKDQEKIFRPNGYPFYHWIQTAKGEGMITYGDHTVKLPPNTGILLFPHVEHSYESDPEASIPWETFYLTFDGSMVATILQNLEINESSFYHWEQETPLTTFIDEVIKRGDRESDIFSLQASTDVYSFLITLNRYGKARSTPMTSSNQLSTLYPLIDWMKEEIGNPDVGLEEMASFLGISKRYLNDLFRKNLHVTPYIYFIKLRIQKGKKLLLENNLRTIKSIAAQVGFRSSSHFVATFHKMVGVTPDQYRRMNGGL
ncbi:AraC-like DNA-binding protein [Evansella vedderi]|uniref:AraC-like DNA-binding protein n=1 Tax=Evansella vedderi TaxID=38282 RepID=A0ABT9ZPS5_9BACI|nr:AraC family transcriptional regulator [Evansella vedderi]MDQ0253204.1 AraC-like DNA-binding protein [Evansella vedderi]